MMVVKADGRQEPFNRDKVLRSAMQMGVTPEVAEQVVRSVEAQVYDGIPTREIAKLLHRELRRVPSLARYGINLRESLALIRPYPDFEVFVRGLLQFAGYKVREGGIWKGQCGEHEIDGILRDGHETLVLEVKHHSNYHTQTGLDVVRIARATLEDFQDGYKHGVTPVKFTRHLTVSNTKLSPQAEKYAQCRGLEFIGWSTPSPGGLNSLILEHRYYPITFLRGLRRDEHRQFSIAKIYTLHDLLAKSLKAIANATGLTRKRLATLTKRARCAVDFRTTCN
jgi:hypothetical protein